MCNDRVCEIKIYDVSSLEDAGKYRVTAKIDYAPIHIGETFALLVDDKPTDEKINVLQIGVGDRQWSKKEPDMITTLIVDSDFEHESAHLQTSALFALEDDKKALSVVRLKVLYNKHFELCCFRG